MIGYGFMSFLAHIHATIIDGKDGSLGFRIALIGALVSFAAGILIWWWIDYRRTVPFERKWKMLDAWQYCRYVIEPDKLVKPKYVVRPLSSKFTEDIFKLHRKSFMMRSDLIHSMIQYVLGDSIQNRERRLHSAILTDLYKHVEVDDTIQMKHIIDYFKDIKEKLNLNEVYYRVSTGNIKTPTHTISERIDIVSEDKIIRILDYRRQETNGKDIYDADMYMKLYIQSLYTNKSIKFKNTNKKLICINLLENEYVEFERENVKLI